MSALDLVLWSLAYLYGFWLLYVLIMGFYRAWLAKRLTRTALVLASPALVIGYLVDWLTNWTLAALWFRQWPQRPLELVTTDCRATSLPAADGGVCTRRGSAPRCWIISIRTRSTAPDLPGRVQPCTSHSPLP